MAGQPAFPVTLIVITRNEAHTIARCLDSVPFVAEKLVVDSGSTDDTVAVAQAHGARVVHQDWLGFGLQRNFATGQATHDWILVLDADEALTPELAAEFERRLPELLGSSRAGAVLRRAAVYMGRRMRGYRPMVGEKIERFYHRSRARWTDARVHERLVFNGAAGLFDEPFLHFLVPSLAHRQLKIVEYSELKARDWLDRGRPAWLWTFPLVFLGIFLKNYILRLAFIDGARGLVVSYVAATYAAYKRIRYYEMVHNPSSREAAARLLRQVRGGDARADSGARE